MKITVHLEVNSTDGSGVLPVDAVSAVRELLCRDAGIVTYFDPSLGRDISVRVGIENIEEP